MSGILFLPVYYFLPVNSLWQCTIFCRHIPLDSIIIFLFTPFDGVPLLPVRCLCSFRRCFFFAGILFWLVCSFWRYMHLLLLLLSLLLSLFSFRRHAPFDGILVLPWYSSCQYTRFLLLLFFPVWLGTKPGHREEDVEDRLHHLRFFWIWTEIWSTYSFSSLV